MTLWGTSDTTVSGVSSDVTQRSLQSFVTRHSTTFLLVMLVKMSMVLVIFKR